MKIVKKCPCCNSTNFLKSPAVLMPFISKRIFDYDLISIEESWLLYNFPSGICLSQCASCQCQDCNFLFLDMRFDDEEMSLLYDDYRGETYTKMRDFYEPGYALKNCQMESGIKYKPEIENFLSSLGHYNSVLDWGGDDGINTPFEDADNVYIYDISGKKVLPNFISLNQNELLDKEYDLIVCSNVLEHVSYPQDILREILPLMNKRTILYIEVPYEKIMSRNCDSNTIYQTKKHWHEHINFFSQKSLEELFKNLDLQIVKQKIHKSSINTDVSNVDELFMIACKKLS